MDTLVGYHLHGCIPHFLRDHEAGYMLVPNVVRKSVVFIGTKDGASFWPRATAFIVSEKEEDFRFVHLVTAKHVISGLQEKGYESLYVRTNMVAGGMREFQVKISDWRFHPDPNVQTDVAVLPTNIDRGDVIYSHIPLDNAATDGVIEEKDIGVGDEVFIVGLFRSHFGQGQNVPIVRTGNIALMPEEPVYTKYCGFMEGYLIEARSIGGFSGSPVWVHMPPIRMVKGKVSLYEGQQYYLLGLMHGHFDVKNITEDIIMHDEKEGTGGINTGIGVVVPVQKIIETIRQAELVGKRRAIVIKRRQEEGAVTDSPAKEKK